VLWHRTEKAIIEQWQADSAYSIEAGEQPLFNLGSSDTTIDGLLGINALQKMIQKRDSIVQPVIAVGGECPLWLFMLLQTTRPHSNLVSDERHGYGNRIYDTLIEPCLVFTSIDSTTHIAALTSQTAASRADSNTHSPKARWTGIDRGWYHLFAPGAEPSTNSPIESLPFTTDPIRNQHHLSRYAQPRSLTLQSVARRAEPHLSAGEQTIWIRRAMIGLAILMGITALFV